jgi:transcriptional regulator GlxA family with amidase domain
MSTRPRSIAIVAFDRVQLLDVAGPLQAFATANDIDSFRRYRDGFRRQPALYRLAVVCREGGQVATSCGLPIIAEPFDALRGEVIDTLIVAGGFGINQALRDRGFVRWIAARACRARRICSVCTGAFALAEAGLLDGRRAVTHWGRCAALAARYPRVRVETDPIFVRDGNIWTSAGITAGIDLALALIEQDHGRSAALEVARQLVVFLKRPGGQSQFSALLAAQAADGDFGGLQSWILENLVGDLSVERLAEKAGMSPRNFARVFVQRTGTTPAKAVERMRVEAARRALEDTAAPLSVVACRCGFQTEERMRRSFVRHLGTAPRQYRQRFSGAAGNGASEAGGMKPNAVRSVEREVQGPTLTRRRAGRAGEGG